MTMPEHDERCRQLAELQEEKESMARLGALAHNAMQRKKVRDGFEYLAQPDVPVPEPSFQYNPRFAALRGEHDWNYIGFCNHCGISSTVRSSDGGNPMLCLRKDADALLECAAACGFLLHEASKEDDTWDLCLNETTDLETGVGRCWLSSGTTVAEAISAALWQAVTR